MYIGGIIAEYDPFHNGHQAHIASMRSAGITHIAAVISGAFTQRGEPAALSKFDRARMAIAGGVDLVLENPLPFAMAPAERFATGGVGTLQALGCVDTLSFGSECGTIDRLEHLASLINTPAYTAALRQALASGCPYAAASETAITQCGHKSLATLLATPNNTLGLEYIRAARRLGADFTFHTLKRIGAQHNATVATGHIASASHIRTLLYNGQTDEALTYIPSSAQPILRHALEAGHAPVITNTLYTATLARLRSMTEADFARLPYISEGLDNRLYRISRTASSYNELIEMLQTRRYPLARLRRILWAALLDLPTENTFSQPQYIRVLATNDRGREILAAAKPRLPILTRAAQIPSLSTTAQAMLAIEERATDLHALALPQPMPCGTDWTHRL